jgi:hypothetical protein
MRRIAASLLALSVVGFACSSTSAPVLQDSGIGPDVGPQDGSIADAAGAFDAGRPDTGVVDRCNPLTQSGCTAPATKCAVDTSSTGATCIEPHGSDIALGGHCHGGDCKPGLACIMTTTSTTVCEKLCDVYGSGAGCEMLGNDFECLARITGTNWGHCVELPPTCDRMTQAPCLPSQACTPILRRTGTWEFRCEPAGNQGDGQPCGPSAGQCSRGYVCIASMQGPTACRSYCSTDQDCAMGEKCIGTVSDPPFKYCKAM